MTEPATDLAPLLWGESVSATDSLGRIEVPVTDTDGNEVGVLHLDHANAVDLANQLLDHASGAAQDAIDAMLAASWPCSASRRTTC